MFVGRTVGQWAGGSNSLWRPGLDSALCQLPDVTFQDLPNSPLRDAASASADANMLRILSLVTLLAFTAFAASAAAAGEAGTTCADAPRADIGAPGEEARVFIQLEHRGLPVKIQLCILDEAGRKVSESTGGGTGHNFFGLGADLPVDKYVAVVDVVSAQAAWGGRGTVSQGIDLGGCRDGRTIAAADSDNWGFYFAVSGRGTACVPSKGVAAGLVATAEGPFTPELPLGSTS